MTNSNNFAVATLQCTIRPSFQNPGPNTLCQHFFQRQNECPFQQTAGSGIYNGVTPHSTLLFAHFAKEHRGGWFTSLCKWQGFEATASHSQHTPTTVLPPHSHPPHQEEKGKEALLVTPNKQGGWKKRLLSCSCCPEEFLHILHKTFPG